MKMSNLYLLFIFLSINIQIKCYIFSVVISIFNTGKYLNESIGSLLNQSIGYDDIQIILVNDGSTDNSEEICLNFQKKYSNNIIYIKLENGGVSKARNVGLAAAKGEFINFLDSDDLWDYKAFEYILSFFQANNEINLVSGRLKFFEAKNNYHYLDYKFYKTRIVNVTEEYNCIQESASTTFFRFSYIKNKKFKEGIKSGEDVRFVNELLLINPLMGLVKEAIYFCRKRFETTSRTQTHNRDLDFYFSSINDVGQYLMNKSLKLYNITLPFIQYYIAYDILFRFESLSFKYLDSYNYEKYCQLIESVLKKIEDKYILEQKNFANAYKIIALSKKYNKDIRYDIHFDKGILKFHKYNLINLKRYRNIIIWKKISIHNNILHLEGVDNLWIVKEPYNYFCKIGTKIYYPKVVNYSNNDLITLFGIFERGKILIFDIDIEQLEIQIIYMFISFFNESYEIFTKPGYLTHLPNIQDGYLISENYIIKMIDKRITLFQYSRNNLNYFEKLYCEQLNKLGKYNIIRLRKRHINHKNILNKKKEIWIINDESDKAGDNGEYFFRYLINNKIKDVDIYYAIQKNCKDYERLVKIGNVIDLNSKKYIDMFLESNKLISSVINSWVVNPFGEDRDYIKDLFHFDFIFINNGIIKDDLSKILNRFDNNIKLFVTSTIQEYNFLLSPKYGYSKNEVILTGMPRFDNLEKYNKKNLDKNLNKIILIIPTWRKFIKRYKNSLILNKIHSDIFKNTEYYQFYNSLINDKSLIDMMKLYNYKGILCLHHNFAAQWIDFNKNDEFEIRENCDYQNLLLNSSLLITDYSSVFFDFGYLKKPIIYSHFDYEEYRLEQYSEGYFNYKRDGFGPIYNNISSIVQSIIKSIKSNNRISKKYLKRIDNFFTFHDEKNSERLFKQIIKIKNINENEAPNVNSNLVNAILIICLLIKNIKMLH